MERRVTELRLPADALVVLVGASGCGKSTFARRHFGATQVVSSDECRRLVADDEADQSASREAFAVFHAILRARMALGRLTVADATGLHPHARERLRAIAAVHRRPVVAILFDVPLDLCLRRAAGRSRVVPPAVIARQHEQLQQAREDVPREGFHRVYFVGAPPG